MLQTLMGAQENYQMDQTDVLIVLRHAQQNHQT